MGIGWRRRRRVIIKWIREFPGARATRETHLLGVRLQRAWICVAWRPPRSVGRPFGFFFTQYIFRRSFVFGATTTTTCTLRKEWCLIFDFFSFPRFHGFRWARTALRRHDVRLLGQRDRNHQNPFSLVPPVGKYITKKKKCQYKINR